MNHSSRALHNFYQRTLSRFVYRSEYHSSSTVVTTPYSRTTRTPFNLCESEKIFFFFYEKTNLIMLLLLLYEHKQSS